MLSELTKLRSLDDVLQEVDGDRFEWRHIGFAIHSEECEDLTLVAILGRERVHVHIVGLHQVCKDFEFLNLETKRAILLRHICQANLDRSKRDFVSAHHYYRG